MLAGCYRRSLEIASKTGVKRIAFPAISCGVYGYPMEEACRIAIQTVADYCVSHPEIEEVRFVLFSQKDLSIYKKIVNEKEAG